MIKKLLVDYHFHPNLSKQDGLARYKCRAIWKTFSKLNIDVAVITEHVYKNPSRAFNLLAAAKPNGHLTHIFPGIEALTKESIDMICFAETEDIYTHQKLMVPKQLSVEEMIDYVQSHPGLYASVAHPFGPGHSGLIRRLGENEGKRLIKKLGTVEVSNACFHGSKKIADYSGLSKIFKQTRRDMDYTSHLPEDFFKPLGISFFTGGSDAHVIVDMGSGMLVPTPRVIDRSSIFNTIIQNTSTEFFEKNVPFYFWSGLYKSYSVFREALTKAFRLYEGKIYQHDDRFTNFYSEAEKETVLAIRKQHGRLVKPLLNFLTYFGFTPNTLNFINIVSVVLSFALVTIKPWLGGSLFLVYLSSSSITGALARYQRQESEAGAVMKVARQYIVVFAAILAGIGFNLIQPFWGALYLGLYIILLWLIIVLNQIGKPIHLVIRSKLLVIASMFLYVLSNINIINELIIGFSLYMIVINGWMLLRYRKATAESQ